MNAKFKLFRIVACITLSGVLTISSVFATDTIAPNVSCSVTNSTLWPADHRFVDVGLGVTVSDNQDPAPRIAIRVFSNEDNDETGNGNFTPDARIAPPQVLLRSERSGSDNGRVYVIIVTASDSSGNAATSFCTVIIPHDQSSASLAQVRQLAAQISAQALPPPGYFLIGNGPDNSNLHVAITSPADNASFVSGEPISLTVSVNFSATKIEYYDGLTKIGESMSSPFDFSWSGPGVGSYALIAVATDNAGARTSSRAVNVAVNQPTPTPTPTPIPTPTPAPTPIPTPTPIVDSDQDGVPDDEDVYPDNPHFDLRRLPDTQYALLPIDHDIVGYGEVIKINNLNHVVRNSGRNGKLTFYKDGNKSLISGFPGNDGNGNPLIITALGGINDADNVVGQANYPYQQIPGIPNFTSGVFSTTGRHAFGAAHAGSLTDLGDLTGDLTIAGDGGPIPVVGANNAHSAAFGINNANVVVGQSDTQLRVDPPETGDEIGILRSSGRHASVWGLTSRRDLGALPGTDLSAALAVNNYGEVAGWGITTYPGSYLTFPHRAVRWSNGAMQDLGALDPRDTTQAVDINDSGYILIQESLVGFFQNNLNFDQAWGLLWRDGDAVFISAAPYSLATGLNANGQIVGSNWNGPRGAFIWQNGQTINLQDRIDSKSGWRIGQALDINNSGVIVGSAFKPATGDSALVLLAPAELMVDANRDGKMSFTDSAIHDDDGTYEDAPYRFWLNDDDDASSEVEQVPPRSPDYADGVIRSKRDLEDFARLHVYLGALNEEIESGAIKLAFEWRDTEGTTPKIKLYRAVSAGTEYLTNEAKANLASLFPYQDTLGEVSPNASLFMPEGFWSRAGSAVPKTLPIAWFLFEGSGEGKGRLVITLWRNNQQIGETPGVWIELKNVKKMYVRSKGVPLDGVAAPWSNDNPLPTDYVFDPNGQDFEPAVDEGNEVLIYVHGIHPPFSDEDDGYNSNIATAETAFKRLWHAGYKGRFAFFKWPALNSAGFFVNGSGFQFNQSEYRALKYGRALARFVASFPANLRRTILAHSQGNAVVAAGFKNYGLQARTWIVTQGAMPTSCYDSDSRHNIFNYRTPDLAAELGYRGFLDGSVPARVVNFCNPEDRVTGRIWELNQELFKPTIELVGLQRIEYWYFGGVHEVHLKTFLGSVQLSERTVNDIHESMAMAAQSLSRSIGQGLNVNGEVDSVVNLNSEFAFGNEHGSQWDRTVQRGGLSYFQRLLDEL